MEAAWTPETLAS